LQRVLDTLVTSAAQLCRAERASITAPKGQRYHRVASHGFPAEFREYFDHHPLAIERGNIVGRVVLEGRTVQIEDVQVDPEFTFVEGSRLGGARTLLGVPLMREGSPIGVLVLARTTVEPFTDRHIELVQTFADQAVIAIENARLLKELSERTETVEAQSHELTKLNQQLEQRVADQVGEIERMGRLRRFLPPQVADLIVASAAIGTVSNVASRLCDEAKPGQILISPRVLVKVENAVKVEPVGEFELKGIRRPLAACNVVSTNSES
jgi:GAF domain-containing protein